MNQRELSEKKFEDLQNHIAPNHGKLRVENGVCYATLIDKEMDPFNVTFGNDNSIEIDTTKISYILLSEENLNQISKLLKESKLYYLENQ